MNMKKIKVLGLYLPQFHNVKENDQWWGEGFTEWSAVKAAKPLFEGHHQPIVPYHNNYYDLLNKQTMEWQTNLMHAYGIDGMCIYHYYFKDGAKILEKPAENLLKWTDIDMPFCFSWANESWVRSWSNISDGNPWSEVIDQQIQKKVNDSGILIEQQYGGEEQWKKHFYYLLPFFRDKRYIKKNGKPVFMFYRAQSIGCLEEMTKYWRSLAIKEGFSGLYFLGANCDENAKQSVDEVFFQEPQDTFQQYPDKFCNDYNVERYLSYDEIWNQIIAKPAPEYPVSFGAFSGYDDSPRRGYRATIIYGRTPDKFEYYMTALLKKAIRNESSFLIVNAWNEWGEGMYLEPDEQNGVAYLEAIRNSKKNILEENEKDDDNYIKENEIYKMEIINLRKQIERHRSFWYLMNKMLTLQENNISIGKYFLEHGYKKVSIYGLGMIGKHLAVELRKSGYMIAFGIDQSKNQAEVDFPVISLLDQVMDTDLIIVTVVYEFSRIKRQISKTYNCEIISLKTILDELTNEEVL